MAKDFPLRSRRWVQLAGVLLLGAAGCAAAPPTAQLPVPAGQARIWIYRDWQPSESLSLANVDVNGAYFGSVSNGGVIYRDVPPGRYHVAPASFVPSYRQDANVDLVPGQQLYVKIVSLSSWGADNTAARNIQRDAFWAWLVPPQVAEAEITRDRSGI
jgi:Protein of unknown function (DUF2846)